VEGEMRTKGEPRHSSSRKASGRFRVLVVGVEHAFDLVVVKQRPCSVSVKQRPCSVSLKVCIAPRLGDAAAWACCAVRARTAIAAIAAIEFARR